MAHSALFEHVKLKKLMRILEIPRPHAIGYWECLCRYVAENYPDGDISSMQTDEIEIAAEWEGVPGAYVGALIDCRFLDALVPADALLPGICPEGTVLVVHDWLDWCPNWVKQRLKRLADRGDVAGVPRGTEPRARSPVPLPEPWPINPPKIDPALPEVATGRHPAPSGGKRRPPAADGDQNEKPHGQPKNADAAANGSQRQPMCADARRCAPKQSRAEQSRVECASTLSAQQQCQSLTGADSDSASISVPSCPDPAAAPEIKVGLSDARRMAAVRQAETLTEVTLSRLLHMPMEPRVSLMLASIGIDDADFRRVVGRTLAQDGGAWPAFLDAFLRCVDRLAKIKNPGGWMRKAMRENGIDL